MRVTGGTLVPVGTQAVKRPIGVDALVTAGKVLRTFVHVNASPAVIFQTKPRPARTLEKKVKNNDLWVNLTELCQEHVWVNKIKINYIYDYNSLKTYKCFSIYFTEML